MIRCISLLVVLLCNGVLLAQPRLELTPTQPDPMVVNDEGSKFVVPEVTIDGANKPIEIGETVELNAVLDSKPKDLHSVSYTWTVLPKRPVTVWPDGTKIIFGTGTKIPNFTVILTTSFVYTVKEDDKIVEVGQRSTTNTVTVEIAGIQDDPQPDNDIDDHPHDNDKDNLNGLSKMAHQWVSLVKRTNSYTNSSVKEDAQKLAESFDTKAAAIAAGAYPDTAAILKATKENNDAIIQNRNEWLPWFEKMSDYLQKSYNDGTIKSNQQFAVAWREISKGLTAAAK